MTWPDPLGIDGRARVNELAAKTAELDAQYRDVPNGTRGAVYFEAVLDTMLRSLGEWPTCAEFGRIAHECYHLATDEPEERLRKAT